MKLLFVAGGYFSGDQLHTIPYLNKFNSEGYNDITIVAGTYSQKATEFLASQPCFNIKKTIFLEDGIPRGIGSRDEFIKKFNNIRPTLNLGTFDKEVIDRGSSFEWQYKNKIEEMSKFINSNWDIHRNSGNYICVQYSSIHAWKMVSALKHVKFPYPVKSLGLPGEEIIPGSEDCRGLPFNEVAKLIMGSKMYIGIHSALSCLTFYLNKPSIIISWDRSTFPFSEFRDNFIDLVVKSDSPESVASIEDSIRKLEGLVKLQNK